jgi:hypothetical protein
VVHLFACYLLLGQAGRRIVSISMTVKRKSILFFVLGWLALTVRSRLGAQQANSSEVAPFKIEVKVNKVCHAVGNLRKEDFQVFDRDKPKVISGFAVEKRRVEGQQRGKR